MKLLFQYPFSTNKWEAVVLVLLTMTTVEPEEVEGHFASRKKRAMK